MKPFARIPALLVALALLAAAQAGRVTAQAPPSAGAGAPWDSLASVRDSLVKSVMASIAGREQMPAESVFKEIRVLKGMPAGRLVRVMDMGLSRSLGVSCDHCHDTADWAKEEKPKKQIARDMWAMTQRINQEILPAVKGLEGKPPTVNCTTCHRGSRVPATRL